MNLPQIQIRLTHAKFSVKTTQAENEIKQPRPDFQIKSSPAKLDMRQPHGELTIDQTRAWDALARTPILEVMHRIYGQARQVAMDGIARIVEDGNRMAAIHEKTNVIADLAERTSVDFPEMQYAGEASMLNVDLHYKANWPEIDVIPGKVDIQSKVNKPEFNYHPGKVDITMRSYPKVDIIPPPPPSVDLRL